MAMWLFLISGNIVITPLLTMIEVTPWHVILVHCTCPSPVSVYMYQLFSKCLFHMYDTFWSNILYTDIIKFHIWWQHSFDSCVLHFFMTPCICIQSMLVCSRKRWCIKQTRKTHHSVVNFVKLSSTSIVLKVWPGQSVLDVWAQHTIPILPLHFSEWLELIAFSCCHLRTLFFMTTVSPEYY